MMILPVVTSPVSETIRTSGSVTSAAPAVLTLAGDDVEARRREGCRSISSASLIAVSGVSSDGLSTTVLPGGECGTDLPDGHHHRVVPRRDGRDDAERVATQHRGVAVRGTHPAPASVEACAPRGEEAEVVDQLPELVDGSTDRLADVARLQLDELVGVLLEPVGDAQQRPAAVGGGEARPGLERAWRRSRRRRRRPRRSRRPRRWSRRSPGR